MSMIFIKNSKSKRMAVLHAMFSFLVDFYVKSAEIGYFKVVPERHRPFLAKVKLRVFCSFYNYLLTECELNYIPQGFESYN